MGDPNHRAFYGINAAHLATVALSTALLAAYPGLLVHRRGFILVATGATLTAIANGIPYRRTSPVKDHGEPEHD